MGRYRPGTSSGHRVQRFSADHYRIFWTVDRYYAGSQLRWPTEYNRDTDKAGAMRFVKKWGVTFHLPEELK